MLLRIGQEDESVSKYGFNVCEIQKVKYTKHLSARVYQTELLNKKCLGQECDCRLVITITRVKHGDGSIMVLGCPSGGDWSGLKEKKCAMKWGKLLL